MERRKTRQRDLVFEAAGALNHPTAQDLYEYILKKNRLKKDKKISLGTIYRNLQILEESGKLSGVPSGTAVMHYDTRLDPHYHVCCKKCGAVFDLPINYMRELNAMVQKTSGCVIESHNLVFEGLCKACASAAAQPAGEFPQSIAL